jgi:hypothetical protein
MYKRDVHKIIKMNWEEVWVFHKKVGSVKLTMKNLLLEKVEYKIESTNFGVWRRFVYPNGAYFVVFKSKSLKFW